MFQSVCDATLEDIWFREMGGNKEILLGRFYKGSGRVVVGCLTEEN